VRRWVLVLFLVSGAYAQASLKVFFQSGLEAGLALQGQTAVGAEYLDQRVAGPWNFSADLSASRDLTQGGFSYTITTLTLGYRGQGWRADLGWSPRPLSIGRLITPYALKQSPDPEQPAGVAGLGVRFPIGDAGTLDASALWTGTGPALLITSRYQAKATWWGSLVLGARPLLRLASSATLGENVVYGEAFLLANPTEARGLVGLSRYLGEALLTLEAAYTGRPLLALALEENRGGVSLVYTPGALSTGLRMNLEDGGGTASVNLFAKILPGPLSSLGLALRLEEFFDLPW